MLNTEFEVYKLKRELKRSGKEFLFKRKAKNEFGEPGSNEQTVKTITGLFHQARQTERTLGVSNEVQYRLKPMPSILCLYSDISGLSVDDYTVMNSKTYKISSIVDIQGWNLIADITMEVVDNGGNF